MNNQISAKVIKDSINEHGNRITTMEITYPRIIHSEVMTHRAFSRNSASSRAIPFKKMVESVQNNPFIPIAWQKDHKGMQGNEYITDKNTLTFIKEQYLKGRDNSLETAKILNASICGNVTKQLCNRLLEPFMWHKVILTATDFENFFNLRCPNYVIEDSVNGNQSFKSKKDLLNVFEDADKCYTTITDWLKINKGQAEIHIMDLAEKMYDALNESTPQQLKSGEWHIPFSDDMDEEGLKSTYGEEVAFEMMIKIATARCARVSYTVVGDENKPFDYEKDIKLHDVLLKSGHYSPFEHIAQASDNIRCANFKGFKQYRTILEEQFK